MKKLALLTIASLISISAFAKSSGYTYDNGTRVNYIYDLAASKMSNILEAAGVAFPKLGEFQSAKVVCKEVEKEGTWETDIECIVASENGETKLDRNTAIDLSLALEKAGLSPIREQNYLQEANVSCFSMKAADGFEFMCDIIHN